MRRVVFAVFVIALAFGLAAAPRHLSSRAAVSPDFVHFESGHVHPIALTPDGNRLLVVNTPDNRLSVFDLTGPAPVRIAEIPVGLEPVSVAARSNGEAWVVNHLSDDVSIVDLNTLHVRATLRVGDEPSDVVFAGVLGHAYVSVSQEDVVKTFDPATLTMSAAAPINGRMPRALAKSPDGSFVYVAVLHAGNRTSVLSEAEAGSSLPPPNPPMDPGLPAAPQVALIIQEQAGVWRDEINRDWDAVAQYSVFDTDVAKISTGSTTVNAVFSDISSTNLGLAVSPVPADGRIATTGTEARNFVRFEPNLRGHMVDTRLGLITTGGVVTLRNLNPHINYGVTPGPQAERDSAIGIPTSVAWSADGERLYVTSLTSNRVAVLDPDLASPILARRPTVAGPTGVIEDAARGRLYVVGRFRNELQTLSTASFASLAVTPIGMDPTPDEIVNGRKFFYGGFTSGHGDQACASCHTFGDFDNLAWDLGDPTGTMQPINTAGQIDPFLQTSVHPMKGPMTTQSLRGLPNTGMFHWRADRQDLDAFNPAFVGLMGRAAALPDSEMQAFDDFVLPLVHPPNPNQFLDRTFRDAPLHQPSAARGNQFFFTQGVDGGQTCNFCHVADNFGPGTSGLIFNRVALQEAQDMKTPHLRNMYRKTGFIDLPAATGKRGFGFIHNGAVDNLFNFLQFSGFNFNSPAAQTPNENRRDVEQFLLSFDTGIAPAVGCQVTFNGPNNSDPILVARLDTLVNQFAAGSCELIAKGRVSGVARGWQLTGGGWLSDVANEAAITTATLRALGGPGSEVTVTGVPVGSARRVGIDRDRDNFLDRDEVVAGSDPGNPASTPLNVGVPGDNLRPGIHSVRPNPFRTATELVFALPGRDRVSAAVYDILGREMRTLARYQWFDPGAQRLSWDGRDKEGRDVAAGVYFIRVETTQGGWTRPVVRVQ